MFHRLQSLDGAQINSSKDGIEEEGTAQIGIAQVDTAQIGTAQVGIVQVGLVQGGLAQVGFDVRILFPPLVPSFNSLFEDIQLLLVCHYASPLSSVWLVVHKRDPRTYDVLLLLNASHFAACGASLLARGLLMDYDGMLTLGVGLRHCNWRLDRVVVE